MKIELLETTVATKDVEGIKDFYSRLLGESANIEDRDFFYTFKDSKSNDRISFVPHNGQEKWNQPWITMITDNMEEALAHIRSLGVQEKDIEVVSKEELSCLTFKDPDGRLVMLMKEDQQVE